MKIYSSIDEFAASGIKNTIVTTGTFDGVHTGHKIILKRLNDLSIKQHSDSVLLTFNPHPRTVLFPDSTEMRFLSTLNEKEILLKESGIKHLIVHPFTRKMAGISAYDYVRNILIDKLSMKTLVIGHDHRFGRGREGSIKELLEWAPMLGFTVEEIAPVKSGEVTVSSSKIRKALTEGDVQIANLYLGYSYSIEATVVKGLNLGGKKLGYPTANLEVTDKSKLVPGDGVYAVYVSIEGIRNKEQGISNTTIDGIKNKGQGISNTALPLTPYSLPLFKGMMNIGLNPTIAGKGRSMEVHIFDFDTDIYGKKLQVLFHKKLRNEKKFSGLETLKLQLDKDKEAALKVLV
ncbi:MAG: bifunctional riboflavin kinase/FMN adenylyltransferase [Bacteroidia bacterium]